MTCTFQSYHDTVEKAREQTKHWREGGFPARWERRGNGYAVMVGSLGDRYHKMKRNRTRRIK